MIEAYVIAAVFGIPSIIVAAIVFASIIALPITIYKAIQIETYKIWDAERREWVDARNGQAIRF